MLKKSFFLCLLTLTVIGQVKITRASNVLSPYQKKLFKKTTINFSNEKVITSPKKLFLAANYALQHFESKKSYYKKLTKSKLFDKRSIPLKQAKETLKFVIKTIKEDKEKNVKNFRINDPNFLKKHFDFIKWNSDQKMAQKNRVFLPKWYDKGKLAPEKIKLTSYAIFRANGSDSKTKKQNCALYEIISKNFKKNVRTKYSKQKILTGIFEQKKFKNQLKPLAWLSREDLEEALMQGSILVSMPDKTEKLFNIFVSNDFVYNKKIKNRWKQKKYWFFKEIKNKKNIHERRLLQLTKLGGVALAGDIENIGLGKIVALKYQNPKTRENQISLGVIADRGSAFSNNLYQLDLFAGTFNNKKDFKKFISQFPPSVNAYLLKKRVFLKGAKS